MLTRRLLFQTAGAFTVLSSCTIAGAQQKKLSGASLWPEASAEATFPLSLKPGASYPVDAGGKPFLLVGDAAWSLIAQLSREDADLYLEDRRARGFNAVLASLVEHKYASHAPANFYREQPFLTPGDFSTPNERYFQHADWVLERAAAKNVLVLLTPDYLGYDGQDEGWWKELSKLGPEKLRAWGRYVGERYARFNNILWVNGGDYSAPDRSIVRAVAEGLRESNPTALQTAHNGPETLTLDYWSTSGDGWLSINSVYTYGPVYGVMREQCSRAERMPAFLIESTYEDEHDSTEDKLRRQAYEAVLAGGFGHVFGNNPMWHFDGPGLFKERRTWKQALDSRGAQSMTHLRNIMHRAKWWTLTPEAGVGQKDGADPPVASRSADGSVLIAYLPKGGSVEIDTSQMAGPNLHFSWYDPSDGSLQDIPAPTSMRQDKRVLQSHSRNAAGFRDWVLLVESVN
jgi:hypothetical protein